MSAKRTSRNARRRSLGQNFLVDPTFVNRIIRAVGVLPDELVVEVGAGSGSLTMPLARAGARVLAVERDPAWVARVRESVGRAGLEDRVRILRADLRTMRLPTEPYRVVANPPFGLTTTLFGRLLDDPRRGPWRADLLVQREVGRKRARTPPSDLRTAAWAPWWTFELGPSVPRNAFRPIPEVDATLLTIRRRDPAVLPAWLAPQLRELLRPGWVPPRR